MTTPIIKVKVRRKSIVKARANVRFPANVAGTNFIAVSRDGSSYAIGADYTLYTPSNFSDPTAAYLIVIDESVNPPVYRLVSASSLSTSNFTEQHLTAPGPAVVGNSTGIVRVDQTVGAPITLTMGLAANKSCPVLISDWKGDAGTNNITINLSGTDKFPGNRTSWTIAADTGSVFLRPISGVGYAL